MMRKYRRPAVVLALVIAVTAALAAVLGVNRPHQVAAKSIKLSADPDRMSAKGTSHSVPGTATAPATQLALQELENKAYPSSTLPYSWQKAAADYFSGQIRARGNDGLSTWQLAGPSIATYPSILNRTNADYVASGRVTAMAIGSTCAPGNCRLWVGAAGGGIWRTDDALASTPSWTYVSGSFATNAIGALAYDAPSNTLYAGTGEPNSSADSAAGVGIYKSTDGGNTWSLLPGSPEMSKQNAIGSIVVSGGTLYVATTYGVAGMSGVGGGAQPSYIAPGTPAPGLWKSTDGGNSFTLKFDDSSGAWGVNHAEMDSHGTLYIASEGRGIFRSSDGGNTWERVFTPATTGNRVEFALNTVDPGGHTRIYIGDGGSSSATTNVWRGDNMDTSAPPISYTKLDGGLAGYMANNYCTGQCWYDNFVVSPAGHPDVVYLGGSYDYNLQPYGITNGAGVLYSGDAGAHWADQTRDAGDNGIHPDQHALVTSPSNPSLFFEGSDGGVMRSSGSQQDVSASRCAPFGGNTLTVCHDANRAVPTQLYNLNAGLSTLQFQNAVANPANGADVMGGTQDNGTWEGTAGNQSWGQTMYGDGGIAAFDSSNSSFRMNEFYAQYTDVNFRNGDPTAWVVVSAPFFASGEKSAFYKPQINDPQASGTFYVGLQSVWRTQDFGGDQATLEANCPEFTTYGDQPGCGDFVPLGDPSGHGGPGSPSDLTSTAWGSDKTTAAAGSDYVVAVSRGSGDKGTLWAATRRGRVFISKNAAGPAGSVSFTRIDAGSGLADGSSATPRRFVSAIDVDPKDPNHAYVSFGGYNNATDGVTPAVAGHVFDVTYDPKTGKAMWTSLDRGSGPLGDIPVTTMVLDGKTNRLYAGTDFGVVTSVGKSGMWRPAGGGMPTVAISGLSIDQASRTLYAATHGRAIWSLKLDGK